MSLAKAPVLAESESSSDSEPEVQAECADDGAPRQLTLVDEPGEHLLTSYMPQGGEEDESDGESRPPVRRKVSGGASASKAPKRRKKKSKLTVCLTACKYEVIRRVTRKFGFRAVEEDEEWNLYWTDCSVSLERVMDMKGYQKINHFPGMTEICRKDLLARNMSRLLKLFPKEYNIFPQTWCMPADYAEFQSYARSKKNKTYICKPDAGCQGRGIFVTKSAKDIKPGDHYVCQVYLSKPFLVDGFKFDMRVYVLVTSCDPLKLFVFKDGLARFATAPYKEPSSSNTENMFMHLTNYAINKNSDDFDPDEESGSKRRLSTVNKWLRERGHDVDKMWSSVHDVIIKTLLSTFPLLRHNYRTCFPHYTRGSACFEILGFDIILDRKLRPCLLEVNHSPSFNTDTAVDREIKDALILDTLSILNFDLCDRRKVLDEERRRVHDRLTQKQNRRESREVLQESQSHWQEVMSAWEQTHVGNYTQIFPASDSAKYDKFVLQTGSVFQETAASRVRMDLARQQREEIERKCRVESKPGKAVPRKKESVQAESPSPPVPRQRVLRPAKSHRWRVPAEASAPAEEQASQRPSEIVEEEEMERISGLLQRDSLLRGLGLVELVHQVLRDSPGASAPVDARPPAKRERQPMLDPSLGAPFRISGSLPPRPPEQALHDADKLPPSSVSAQRLRLSLVKSPSRRPDSAKQSLTATGFRALSAGMQSTGQTALGDTRMRDGGAELQTRLGNALSITSQPVMLAPRPGISLSLSPVTASNNLRNSLPPRRKNKMALVS